MDATHNSRYSRLAVPGLVIAAAAACHVVGGDELEEIRASIDDYVRGLDTISAEPSLIVTESHGEPVRDGEYICRSRPVQETRQYDELVAYSTNSEALWPGALVRSDEALGGDLAQVVMDRDPVTISISLENIDGQRKAVMDYPSLSAYREGKAEILDNQVTGSTPAHITADIEEVHSEEQLEMAFGAGVSGTGLPAELSASFNFGDEDVRSRYLVQYTQAYYTIDIDQPGRPSDFFAPTVTDEDVMDRFPEGSPPAYVSSITYGRVALFAFESEYSAQELGAALDFAYSGGVDVGGDVSVTYEEMLERSKMSVYMVGGSGADAAKALDGYEELMDFIRSGGDYSSDSPGAPIAYKLSYLKDNAPLASSVTREYEKRDCERVGQAVRVTLNDIEVEDSGGRDKLNVYGSVGARGEGERTLLTKDENNYIGIEESRYWPGEGDLLGDAILEVRPESGETIELEADLFHHDTGWWFPSDSDIGWETVSLPFEQGWRGDQTALLTGDGAKVRVNFSIQPI